MPLPPHGSRPRTTLPYWHSPACLSLVAASHTGRLHCIAHLPATHAPAHHTPPAPTTPPHLPFTHPCQVLHPLTTYHAISRTSLPAVRLRHHAQRLNMVHWVRAGQTLWRRLSFARGIALTPIPGDSGSRTWVTRRTRAAGHCLFLTRSHLPRATSPSPLPSWKRCLR